MTMTSRILSRVAAIRNLQHLTLNVSKASRHPSLRATQSRCFSLTSSRRLMEMYGFTTEQLDVREAVSKICAKYPDEYWAEHDESGEYPHELHADLAKDGWIGIALSEELGGAGLGISEATMMLHTISE
jgi:acyl-CoA dehydrogenase